MSASDGKNAPDTGKKSIEASVSDGKTVPEDGKNKVTTIGSEPSGTVYHLTPRGAELASGPHACNGDDLEVKSEITSIEDGHLQQLCVVATYIKRDGMIMNTELFREWFKESAAEATDPAHASNIAWQNTCAQHAFIAKNCQAVIDEAVKRGLLGCVRARYGHSPSTA